MHTYRKMLKGNDDNADNYVWVVGYYVIRPGAKINFGPVNSEWNELSEHPTELGAIKRVNILNGGPGTNH